MTGRVRRRLCALAASLLLALGALPVRGQDEARELPGPTHVRAGVTRRGEQQDRLPPAVAVNVRVRRSDLPAGRPLRVRVTRSTERSAADPLATLKGGFATGPGEPWPLAELDPRQSEE